MSHEYEVLMNLLREAVVDSVIHCPECGMTMEADAEKCPECGWANILKEEGFI